MGAGQRLPGQFSPIIERNTIVPVSRQETYFPMQDGQDEVELEIYQGESRLVRDNILLGTLRVPLPRRPREECAFDVRFTYDVNGLLEVEAMLQSGGATRRTVIQGGGARMSDADIQRRLAELAQLKIHPREHAVNRVLLLAQAERVYQMTRGGDREALAGEILLFEQALATQEERAVARGRERLRRVVDILERAAVFAPGFDPSDGSRSLFASSFAALGIAPTADQKAIRRGIVRRRSSAWTRPPIREASPRCAAPTSARAPGPSTTRTRPPRLKPTPSRRRRRSRRTRPSRRHATPRLPRASKRSREGAAGTGLVAEPQAQQSISSVAMAGRSGIARSIRCGRGPRGAAGAAVARRPGRGRGPLDAPARADARRSACPGAGQRPGRASGWASWTPATNWPAAWRGPCARAPRWPSPPCSIPPAACSTGAAWARPIPQDPALPGWVLAMLDQGERYSRLPPPLRARLDAALMLARRRPAPNVAQALWHGQNFELLLRHAPDLAVLDLGQQRIASWRQATRRFVRARDWLLWLSVNRVKVALTAVCVLGLVFMHQDARDGTTYKKEPPPRASLVDGVVTLQAQRAAADANPCAPVTTLSRPLGCRTPEFHHTVPEPWPTAHA